MKKSASLFLALALALLMIPTSLSAPAQAEEIDVACSKGGGTFKISGTTVTSFTENCLGSIEIPAYVTGIGFKAFYSSKIASVTFADEGNLTTIGIESFSNTTNLASISIPATVTTIGQGAFAYSGLASVTFADGSNLTTIGIESFRGLALTSITIPASVTTLHRGAFSINPTLLNVYFLGNQPLIPGGGASGNNSLNTGSSITAHVRASATGFSNNFDNTGTATNGKLWNKATVSVNNFFVFVKSWNGMSVEAVSSSSDGDIQTQPVVIRPGYALDGFSATEGGSLISFPYLSGATSDITLYAKWDANTYAVNLNAKGGSSVPSVSFKAGGAISSAPTTPIRPGYTLLGWSATDGGSSITFPYAPGVVENITLYANWALNPYKPELLANATVSGTGLLGTNMKANFGSWSALPDAVLSVQWYRCDKAVAAGLSSIAASSKCVKISGATKTTYKVVLADELKYLTVLVQAKNSIGTTTTTAKSFRTPALKAPTKGTLPDIDGSAIAKQALTVAIGTWTSNPIAKTSVQWFRCEKGTKVSSLPVPESSECTAINGATKLTYTLSKADEGKYVTAQIKAQNAEGTAFTTAKSPRVALTPSSVNDPAISGSALVGRTLQATSGSWSAFPTAQTNFKWYRCANPTATGSESFSRTSGCVAIVGETKSRYTVSKADQGKYLSVLVNAANSAGSSSSTARSTAKVG